MLLAAHVYAVPRPELAGPVLALDHLFNVALTGAVLALCSALGMRLSRSLGIPYDSRLEELAFSTALGAGALGTLLLVLGVVGGIDGLAMALLFLGCGAVARRELGGMWVAARAATREFAEQAGAPALLAFVAVAVCMVALSTAPPTDYDTLMYHLQIPTDFLQRGGIHVPDGNLHVAFLGPIHLLYVPLVAWGAAPAAALLNVAFALLLGVAVLAAGTRLFSPTSGRLALVLLWGSPALLLAAVTPRVDSVLACYLFLGHYALLRAGRAAEHTVTWCVLASALLGLAIGVKYLGLGYMLALGPVLLVVLHQCVHPAPRRAVVLTTCFGVALAGALPWLLKNWILVGAPLYPQLTPDILPPWLAALHGSSSMPASVDPASLNPLHDVREVFSVRDWFLAPERMTPEAEGTAYVANRAFPLLVLGVALVRNRTFVWLLAPALLFIVAVLIHNTSLNVRYLTPALPALTLAVAVLIAHAVEPVRRPGLRALALLAVAAFSLAPTLTAVIDRFETTGAAMHALGATSRADYLRNPRNGETADYVGMASRVNQLTTADDRILMLFESRGFRFEAYTLPDTKLVNWLLLAAAMPQDGCLESTNITHVLLAARSLGYYRSRGLDPTTLDWDRFPDFAARCLTPVEATGGWVLFRVRAG